MEIDKTILILAIILLAIVGIFALVKFGSSGGVSNGAGYVAQYGGGACGR